MCRLIDDKIYDHRLMTMEQEARSLSTIGAEIKVRVKEGREGRGTKQIMGNTPLHTLPQGTIESGGLFQTLQTLQLFVIIC